MDLILIGAVIGFIGSWLVFRRENWRLEDKIAEKQEQIDNMIRAQIAEESYICSKKRGDYFANW